MVNYNLTDDMAANAATFNILFGDVNLRLKELEKAGSALKKARDEIVDLGLARINEVVGPALQAVEDISDLSDLFRAASVSSVEIGTGVREFNIEPGDRLKFAAPLYVAIAVNGQLDKWMAGQVQSWNNETGQLMVDVTNIRGEGIFADWVVTPTHIPETGPTINAYTKVEVDAIVAQAKTDLLGGSPAAALDTLAELAAALADDADGIVALTAQLDGKADLIHTHAQSDITGLTADLVAIQADITALESLTTPGSVQYGQVQETLYTTQSTLSSVSGWTDTGLSLAITPSATDSTIEIDLSIMAQAHYSGANNGNGVLRLVRSRVGAAQAVIADGFGMAFSVGGTETSTGNSSVHVTDSPATLLQCTYKVQVKPRSGANTIYINRTYSGTSPDTFCSSMRLKERLA